MDSTMADYNPLKRSFDDIDSSNSPHMVSSGPATDFLPREYQLKVFDVAKKRNTIAVLETGAGKTMIAVMLIKHIAESLKSNGDKKLVVFLAPSVHLVHQQCDVITSHVELKVGKYYGAMNVDGWNLNRWEEETKQNDVLVMTPQILLDALKKAFLRLEAICFIVFDECHHATGNHPYSKIMKDFYHKANRKPKIFGMTASPVVRKGVSSAVDCEGQISELENILDSQVYTVEDRSEMELYIPSASESVKYYNPSSFTSSDLKAKMKDSWLKFDACLSKLQSSMPNCYEDMEDKFKTWRKQLSNYHAKILYCLDELGLVCAYEAVKVCTEKFPSSKEECDIYRESSLLCQDFLKELLCIIKECLPQGGEINLESGFNYSNAVDSGYISPKLYELLQLFASLGRASQVLCLIFVDRIIAAKVVERFMKKVTCLDHLTVSYLTGSKTSVDAQAPQMQKEILESFRCGKINLLFATDVIEEGIHVPKCSCVIRFDLPKTVRSYIQSRGRARQNDSQFVVMLERENMKQRDQIYDVIRSERSMTDTAMSRDPDVCFARSCTFEKTNAYIVEATGASVSVEDSVRLIHQYCQKLPSDKYYSPKPNFKYKSTEGLYECEMTLPCNAAFQSIVGPASRNKTLAKQLVCLEACRKLHQMGALDDHLLPCTDEPSVNNLIMKNQDSGAGTTKRKELHGTVSIRALHGSWGENVNDTVFHAYKFDFGCSIVDEIFSGFVLLIESKLDQDVGNLELELYLVSKTVKVTVSSCGQVHLDAKQIVKAKRFQELFFNGLFGKLFVKPESPGKSGTNREFLLKKETNSLWSASNMYLLLPLETIDSCSQETWRINWTGLEACASVINFLKENSFLGSKKCNAFEGDSLPSCNSSMGTSCMDTDIIHLANCSFEVENLKEKVVLAIHTGRIYSIVEVVRNKSAMSPFDANDDALTPEYTSFADYFCKKYGIQLKYPGQPLLRLKQSHNPHNLLVKFHDEGSGRKPQMHVHIPPELLVSIDISRSVVKSLYLLPSLMQRLESLMLASQLREEIDCHPSNHIPSSLILEGLTTLRCCESFSMERLELLGDSVLKYVVSCHLFITHPKMHEGQLSARRSLAVCNKTLYHLGIHCKLQGYIRDGAFDPRRWIAPGQLSLRPSPCKCGVDSIDIPLDAKYFRNDEKVVVGKVCDMGHRWIGSKTIADCVEALVGAYYVAGGLHAALHVMKWLKIDADLEPSLVLEAITSASLRSYIPKTDEIKAIESIICYEFAVKFLLQEALTHASVHESYCYQRLEFLGDSALDLLITWHLYQSHKDIDPGELTDLRSASVNNDNFAQVVVRHNLYKHLQHRSTLLQNQITEYVNSSSTSCDTTISGSDNKAPKALGDLFESIAGGILIDTKLNLEEVWRVFKPLLSPIVTPDKLELPPQRELIELCDSLGYFIKEKCTPKGEMIHAELRLQLEDILLIGHGHDPSRKVARGKAASQLLKQLEKKGICKGTTKTRKPEIDISNNSSPQDLRNIGTIKTPDEKLPEPAANKKQKISEGHAAASDPSEKACDPNLATPVIGPINMKKGGPRSCLFELCKTRLWPMPTFQTTEHTSRTLIVFGEGPDRRTGFNSYTSNVTLHIPNSGAIECSGDPRADKKSSFDSAAVVMLFELERQGKIIIAN